MSAVQNGAVTVMVSRRVKPGHVQAFEAGFDEVVAAAGRFPGHLGGHVVRPEQDGGQDSNLYHVVFAFRSAAELAAWQNSPERREVLARLAPFVESQSTMRPVSGLEMWFTPPSPSAPPRWKVATVTWLGIFPTVLVLTLLLGDLLAPVPLVPRVMIMTVLITAIMTWVVAPRLTTWLKGWLHAKR